MDELHNKYVIGVFKDEWFSLIYLNGSIEVDRLYNKTWYGKSKNITKEQAKNILVERNNIKLCDVI